ncbi:unnamed protein product [Caenorhabditis bovis]|uniref:SHSP domain-containing protein n=1 Tax=Caenorhabditis bovis TaxID=2654633 RepID=A0A8S1F3E0_9PELO|nr:unnamed protein product [Caenorhabditis bovis]
MSLTPFTHRGSLWPMMRNYFNDEDFMMAPFWSNRHISNNFDMAADIGKIENNDQKFAVKLDVSQFAPEELKVNLEGNLLTVSGEHEVKSEHGFTKRSFTRQFTLPKDADLNAIHTAITKEGQLAIDVPKTGASTTSRAIPIHTPCGKAITPKTTANNKH